MPFQRKVSVAVPVYPTAQAFVADGALIPARMFMFLAGCGLATMDHFVPFQCSISGRVTGLAPAHSAVHGDPAAQALAADVAVTAVRVLRLRASGTSKGATGRQQPSGYIVLEA